MLWVPKTYSKTHKNTQEPTVTSSRRFLQIQFHVSPTPCKRSYAFGISLSTPRSKSLVQKLIVAQMVKKFRASLSLEDLLSCSESPAAVPAASQSNNFHSFVMYSFKLYFQARSQNCEKLILISSCLSVRFSVRMEQLGSHWTDFH